MPYRSVRRFRKRRPLRSHRRFRVRFARPVKYFRRRKFRGGVRRRALARVQNLVKFTSKGYSTYGMAWPVADSSAPSNSNYLTWDSRFDVGNFIPVTNFQFYRNLQDYQWVKFNYFAIKIHELLYVGISSNGNGVTAIQGNKYPMYFCWDVEQEMSWPGDSSGSRYVVSPQALTQYEGTKNIQPSSKRPISFVWKVPMVWRQFLSTDMVNSALRSDPTPTVSSFFEDLTNIKNLRVPSKLLGTHANWWQFAALPTESSSIGDIVTMRTQIGLTFYCGATFRGRRIMGATIPTQKAEEVLQNETVSDIEQDVEDDLSG